MNQFLTLPRPLQRASLAMTDTYRQKFDLIDECQRHTRNLQFAWALRGTWKFSSPSISNRVVVVRCVRWQAGGPSRVLAALSKNLGEDCSGHQPQRGAPARPAKACEVSVAESTCDAHVQERERDLQLFSFCRTL